ncbi:MAG: hypothetical protein AAFO81_00565 [Pseudomonadota bacterium]
MTSEWPRDTQKRALLVWLSFLNATVMSLVFFAFVDPLLIVDEMNITALQGREMGYALVFFFFWAGSASSAWLCLRLARRKRQGPKPVGNSQ